MANLLHRLRQALGLSHTEDRTYEVDPKLVWSLRKLAEKEHRPPQDLAEEILQQALEQQQRQDEVLQNRWQRMTARQQEVAGWVCLGYNNREIGELLEISPATVKVHVRHILSTFDVRNRIELQLLLQDWDFSGWGKPRQA